MRSTSRSTSSTPSCAVRSGDRAGRCRRNGTTVLISSRTTCAESEDVRSCGHHEQRQGPARASARPELQANIVKGVRRPADEAQLPEGLDILHRSAQGHLHTLIVHGDAAEVMNRLSTAQPQYLDVVPLTPRRSLFMNWEVQTMPSKTSFCNGTEFRKCLSRWWPLWIIYGVILFILLPGVLLNARTTTTVYDDTVCVDRADRLPLERHSRGDADAAAADGVFARGSLQPPPMFGYLYTPRGAGWQRRCRSGAGCMFRTHLLAGLLMLLSAEAVIFGLAVPHRGDAFRTRHRAAAHLAGHTRARDGRILTASPCCAPCSPATWSCCRACTCS